MIRPVRASSKSAFPVCLVLTFLFLALPGLAPSLLAAGRGEPGPVFPVRVELTDEKADVKLLGEMDLDIDGVFNGWARLYVVAEEVDKLRALGFGVSRLPETRPPVEPGLPGEDASDSTLAIPASYHTFDTLSSELQTIATDHADLVRVSSIGLSVQNRELWMVKISANPGIEEDEPELAYISSMHGDEVVGKELCIGLIDYLTDNYGSDPRVTALLDSAEIWIMPSMNPDGTALTQRYNANGYDLNRNFPDYFSDPVNTIDGRQPETAAVMNWSVERRIILSANYHGGALLMNYPFDNNPEGASVFSPTPDPDHDAIFSMARVYADNNLPMYNVNSGSIVNGVTNGAAWYAIDGGMQDWRYAWHAGFEITIEVSETKWPAASTLPQFWADNLESMLSYLEHGLVGVRGLVTDLDTGAPVAAEIRLDANPFPGYTDPDLGDYHRVVLPGSYSMEVSAVGYATQVVPITVVAGPAVRYDVALQALPTTLQSAGNRVEDGAGGDGWLDAAEPADLAVTLRNLGKQATGVTAELLPTGWFARVTRKDAGYPDIATAQQAESDAPHFGVLPEASIPAGHKLGFAVRWQADGASGVTEPFFLDVGAPSCAGSPAVDVPQPIADYQTTTSQLTVAQGVSIAGVQVEVDISHTYIGDLVVKLVSPTGTPVLLHNRGGGSQNDIVGTYGVDLTPAEPLDAFLGKSSDGTWTLTVEDLAGGDSGSVNGWTLHLCGHPGEAATPEMRFSGLVAAAGSVTLQWWPYPGLTSYKVYRSTDSSSAGAFFDVTGEDGDPTDTEFVDTSVEPLVFYLVTGVGPAGEGPKGHFGQ